MRDLATGEVLDAAWRLEEQIGQGGMGRVFRATDLKLGRQAAVKVLSINNIDDETVKRFEREAQVMGKLRHRGVVTLYTVGRTHGIPWLAMQFLEGRSLWKVLAEHGGTMSPEVLLPIARQLLVTLAYIHGNKLLHRDLKPSNIHVSSHGHVTLLDLGLARGHKSNLTRTGVVWGTPDYMAPEQIAGERELDGRADLYSLSVVLYRMLSGKAPFGDNDDQDLMRAHMTQPRPDVSRVVPGLSLLLGAALQKGLAIHPEDRFQSAEEMLTALERAMASRARDAPTTATPRPSAQTEPHPVLSVESDLTPNDGFPARKPVGRQTTGETKAVDLPTQVDNPPVQLRHAGRTDPLEDAIRIIQAETGTGALPRLSLEDEDDSDSVRTQREGFAAVDPATTSREGFAPVIIPRHPSQLPSSTVVEDEDDSGPTDRATKPSQPMVAAAPPPAFLTWPYLVGAVVLLIVGVLLGRFL